MSSGSRRDFLKSSVLGLAGSGVLAGCGANTIEVSDTLEAEIFEPARLLPVFAEADICVLGGSCTGVFAAIRAARLGAKVVLVEKPQTKPAFFPQR